MKTPATMSSLSGLLPLHFPRALGGLDDRLRPRRLVRGFGPCDIAVFPRRSRLQAGLLVFELHRGAQDVVVKHPRDEFAAAVTVREHDVLRRLDADRRLDPWRDVLPRVVGSAGPSGAFAQQILTGVPAERAIRDSLPRPALGGRPRPASAGGTTGSDRASLSGSRTSPAVVAVAADGTRRGDPPLPIRPQSRGVRGAAPAARHGPGRRHTDLGLAPRRPPPRQCPPWRATRTRHGCLRLERRPSGRAVRDRRLHLRAWPAPDPRGPISRWPGRRGGARRPGAGRGPRPAGTRRGEHGSRSRRSAGAAPADLVVACGEQPPQVTGVRPQPLVAHRHTGTPVLRESARRAGARR